MESVRLNWARDERSCRLSECGAVNVARILGLHSQKLRHSIGKSPKHDNSKAAIKRQNAYDKYGIVTSIEILDVIDTAAQIQIQIQIQIQVHARTKQQMEH